MNSPCACKFCQVTICAAMNNMAKTPPDAKVDVTIFLPFEIKVFARWNKKLLITSKAVLNQSWEGSDTGIQSGNSMRMT